MSNSAKMARAFFWTLHACGVIGLSLSTWKSKEKWMEQNLRVEALGANVGFAAFVLYKMDATKTLPSTPPTSSSRGARLDFLNWKAIGNRRYTRCLTEARPGTTTTSRYLFHDQLGSVARITDAAGVVQASLDYIPAGARRSMSDPMQVEEGSPALSDRGFTGHEHLDGVGVIHMNGRIYDPGLGRFLQPDPFVQAPGSAQSWNAYTYVFNNPLRYTDPTGMLGQSERGWLGAIMMIVAVATQQYWAAGLTGTSGAAITAGVYAGVGFVSGAVATQSWRGGLMGAMTALITAGVRIATVDGGVAGWGVQTFTGGVTESLRGGNFGHAFASAGLSAAFMPQRGQIPNPVARTMTGAIVGGTISRATGGKFANGAVTGAIQAAMTDGKDEPGHDSITGSGDTDVSAAAFAPRETVAVREIYDVGYIQAHQQVGAEMAAYAQNGGPELCTAACPIERTSVLGIAQQGYRFKVETINSNVVCANSMSCGNMTAVRSMHVHGAARYRISSLDSRLDRRLRGKVGNYSRQDINNFSGIDKRLDSNLIYSPVLGLRLWQKHDRSVIEYGK